MKNPGFSAKQVWKLPSMFVLWELRSRRDLQNWSTPSARNQKCYMSDWV